MCLNCQAQKDSVTATSHIDEVEVTAMSLSNDLHSIAPHYSLKSADFQRLNISDISSALRRLPGTILRDYGGAGGMKTVSVRGMGAQHTGVSLDGMLLTDVQSGQIDLQQFQLSEITSLSLAIAGSADIFQHARNLAAGSVLSITTSDSAQSYVAVETGSWGYVSPSSSMRFNLGNMRLSLKGSYTTAKNDYPFTVHNGVATHRERRADSQLKQGSVNVASLWDITREVQLKSTVRLFDSDRQLPGLVRLYVNENDETLRDRGILAQTVLNSRIGKSLWLKTGLRWNWSEQAYHNGLPNGFIRSERYIQREYYATTAVLYKPLHNLDLSYAVDFFHNNMTSTVLENTNPHRDTWLHSLSGRYNYGRFVVVANLINSNIGEQHHLSPSVMLSYMPFANHDFMLRLSAKDAFRMPTMTEQYYYHFGSKNLRPEKSRQLNLGITFSSVKPQRPLNMKMTADIYINKVSDKIVAIPFNMFVWRYLNLTKTVGRGADLTAELSYALKTCGQLLLTANYSYQRVGMFEVREPFVDNQIAYMPKHSGSATLAWMNRWCNVSTTLSGASQQWTNNEHNGEPLPAYSEVAVSVFRTFSLPAAAQLNVSLMIQNLFDKEYSLVALYPMPGRNIKINVQYKF